LSALWYASRAAGLVALVLLSATMTLGVLGVTRFEAPRWPRFVLAALHRNIALLAVVFLALHAATAVIDPYAGIGWLDTLLPFSSVYQPFALGLGAVALDLLGAVLITSLLRPWISYCLWRAVHWITWVCWPIAVLHGFLIGGADSHTGWVLLLTGGCVLVVLAAGAWRTLSEPAAGDQPPIRASGGLDTHR
jgi:predicted ferric reductase